MKIWLDDCVLNWYINGTVGSPSEENIQECYDYFNYAESLIDDFDDKFHIQDCIKNLKYVVDKRIKQLERIYDFRSYFPRKHILETYKQLGIVKGFVITKLFIIRNNIEHNELEYSDKEQCHDLLDTVWYFLKSTDDLVYEANVDNTLYNNLDNGRQWIEINVETPKINVASIRGIINVNLISRKPINNFLMIDEADVLDDKEDLVYIRGNIVLDNNIKVSLAKKFFINKILNHG